MTNFKNLTGVVIDYFEVQSIGRIGECFLYLRSKVTLPFYTLCFASAITIPLFVHFLDFSFLEFTISCSILVVHRGFVSFAAACKISSVCI